MVKRITENIFVKRDWTAYSGTRFIRAPRDLTSLGYLNNMDDKPRCVVYTRIRISFKSSIMFCKNVLSLRVSKQFEYVHYFYWFSLYY